MSTNNGNLVLREHPWRYFRKELRTHYTHSKGAPGRSLFYGIYLGYHPVGVVGVCSTTLPMMSVIKEVYKVDHMTPEIKRRYSDEIVNNDILRILEPQQNLASRVLSKFTKTLYRDFYKRYDIQLRGIVTLTLGENERDVERTGTSYKAANWKYLGLSKGGKKAWSEGRYVYKRVNPKHVWLWKYDEHHEKKPRPSSFDSTHEEELRLAIPKDEPEAPTVELLDDNSNPTGVEN